MITWNVDPEIFNLNIAGFHLAPRYYGLAYVIGFFLGEKYVSKYMLKAGFVPKDVSILFRNVLIGTIVGARLAHCLFYEPGYYLSHPLDIIKVWQGGLASHGGFIGVMVGAWVFNKQASKKVNWLWLLDLIAAPALMSGAYIRVGNLFNSEIIGLPTDLPWAFIFKRVDNIPRHPSQLYEAFGFAIISLVVSYLYKQNREKWPRGRFVGIILICGMLWRFFIEFFKENQAAFEQGMALNMGQILSFIMILVGIFLVLKKDPTKKL